MVDSDNVTPTDASKLSGVIFPESPRWYQGKLLLSDIRGGRVISWQPDAGVEEVVRAANWPSGLGFTQGGDLLLVTMLDGRLWIVGGSGLQLFADLSGFGTGGSAGEILNDMVVDGRGNAYVDLYGIQDDVENGGIVLVTPDGRAAVVADGLAYPNGLAVTPDNRTLLVAETKSSRITAFEIDTDGHLQRRRLWADLPGDTPDGICLDGHGALWVGSAFTERFCRVATGGAILDHITIPGKLTLAPMLGGRQGTTLYLLTCAASVSELEHGVGQGFVERREVTAPKAGWP